MITRKTTIVEKEFDADGNLVRETTTTEEETDNNLYQRNVPYYPSFPDWTAPITFTSNNANFDKNSFDEQLKKCDTTVTT